MKKYYLALIPFLLLTLPRIYPVQAQDKVITPQPPQNVATTTIEPAIATQLQIKDYVYNQSVSVGVSPTLIACLATHEAQWNPSKIGDIGNRNGESYGLFQIEVKQHPDVTEAEALDYKFATNWTVEQVKLGNVGMWSTYWEYCE